MGITGDYHMARTAPRALLLQSYWENPRMRAVRISASRAGKSRTALLGTCTSPRDAILGVFVAFKHPSNLQLEKQMQTTYYINFLCIFLFFYFVLTSSSECSKIVLRAHMIKCLLTEFRSRRTGKYLALGHGARTSLRSVRTP